MTVIGCSFNNSMRFIYINFKEPQKRVVFIARLCPLLGNFKLLKINFVIPEDRRFVSCKFDVNPSSTAEIHATKKTADGQTDGFSALYSRLGIHTVQNASRDTH